VSTAQEKITGLRHKGTFKNIGEQVREISSVLLRTQIHKLAAYCEVVVKGKKRRLLSVKEEYKQGFSDGT